METNLYDVLAGFTPGGIIDSIGDAVEGVTDDLFEQGGETVRTGISQGNETIRATVEETGSTARFTLPFVGLTLSAPALAFTGLAAIVAVDYAVEGPITGTAAPALGKALKVL